MTVRAPPFVERSAGRSAERVAPWSWILLVPVISCAEERTVIHPPFRVEDWIPRDAVVSEDAPVAASSESEILPIDLATALQLADAHSIEVLLAREKVTESKADEGLTRSQYLPVLAPRFGFFRHEGETQSTEGDFLDVDKQNAFAGAGIEISANPAEAMFSSLAARRRTGSREFLLESVQRDMALRAATYYYDLVQAAGLSRLAEDAIAHAREVVSVQESLERQGRGLPVDVMRARAELAKAEGSLFQASEAARVASASLVEVLRLDPTIVLVPAEDELKILQFLSTEIPLPELIARARQGRPELHAAEEEIRALEEDERSARYSWAIPRVRLGTTLGGFGETFGSLDDQETYSAALQWGFTFGLSHALDRAESEKRRAELLCMRAQDRVAAEVVRAWERVKAAPQRIAAANRETEAAQATRDLADARHEAGAALMVETLDAEASLTRARTSLLFAIADHNRAQYELLHAVGGMVE